MKIFYQLAGVIMLTYLSASCAGKTTVSQKKVRSGLDSYNSGYELTKDEHGMTRSASKKISHYNNQRNSNLGATDISGKDYNKASYRKARWGGDKSYTAEQYGGKTDGSRFQHSPHYVSRSAYDGGGFQTVQKNQFNTGRYNTGRAQEAKSDTVKTGSSGYVTSQNNAPEPLIMSRDEYNKLSVRDTKSLLGR